MGIPLSFNPEGVAAVATLGILIESSLSQQEDESDFVPAPSLKPVFTTGLRRRSPAAVARLLCCADDFLLHWRRRMLVPACFRESLDWLLLVPDPAALDFDFA